MLQVSYIKNNLSRVVSNLNKRNIDFSKQLQEITKLDDLRKKIQLEYDSILNESNTIAKEMANSEGKYYISHHPVWGFLPPIGLGSVACTS